MTSLFFTQILPASDFTDSETRTRSEQTPFDDRLPETAFFEDHPVGIEMFTKVLPKSKPRGRGGVKRVEFTPFEQGIVDMMKDCKPVREIAANHGLTWSECQRIVTRLRARISMREWRARQ